MEVFCGHRQKPKKTQNPWICPYEKKNNNLWFFSTWLGNPHVDDDSEQGPPMFVMWPIKVVML